MLAIAFAALGVALVVNGLSRESLRREVPRS